jgi:hypothetical protein
MSILGEEAVEPQTIVTYKSVDTVAEADEAVN